MKEERNPLVEQIARFGLPLVILIFYCTASLEFKYTPDSTYQVLHFARLPNEGNAVPSPLWLLLLSLGSRFHLDLLLTAKVFSLFFSCFVILISYLIAFEVLRDRVLSFCLSLVVALQPWLLQSAPSGSALAFGVMLVVTSIFFILRNDYVLSTIFIGLSTMVFPEAMVLMGLLVVDVLLNSVEKSHAWKVVVGVVIVYCSTLIPWILYAAFNGIPALPALVSFGEFPELTVASIAALGILVLFMIVAIARLIESGETGRLVLRTQTSTMLWVCFASALGLAGRQEFLLMAIPLLAVYAFFGLRELIIARYRKDMAYTVAFVLTGILLVQSQLASSSVRTSIMNITIEEESELVSIAYWLKVNSPVGATVMAEKPGIIGYHSDRAVSRPSKESEVSAEYIVSQMKSLGGYEVAYDPDDVALGVSPAHHFSVLRKTKE